VLGAKPGDRQAVSGSAIFGQFLDVENAMLERRQEEGIIPLRNPTLTGVVIKNGGGGDGGVADKAALLAEGEVALDGEIGRERIHHLAFKGGFERVRNTFGRWGGVALDALGRFAPVEE